MPEQENPTSAAPPPPSPPAKPAGPPLPELSARGRAIADAVVALGLPLSDPRSDHGGWPIFDVLPAELLNVAKRISCDLNLTYLACLTPVEWPDRWETVYHLYDFARCGFLVLKAANPKEELAFPSVTAIWPAANWYEREAYDMFGLIYEGHPHLCRILMSDDWPTFPMRKDQPMDVEGGY